MSRRNRVSYNTHFLRQNQYITIYLVWGIKFWLDYYPFNHPLCHAVHLEFHTTCPVVMVSVVGLCCCHTSIIHLAACAPGSDSSHTHTRIVKSWAKTLIKPMDNVWQRRDCIDARNGSRHLLMPSSTPEKKNPVDLGRTGASMRPTAPAGCSPRL